jgi:hypothetical protein
VVAAPERVAEPYVVVNSHTNASFPLNEARTRLADAEKGLQRAEDARDAAEERARTAGRAPGWLR